jgi:nucleolar protein 14
MQRRNKVGGLIDRRFGEDDPNMSLEDKMMERFTREQQRNHKKSSMFDLEEDDESMGGLTHMGRPLFDDDEVQAPVKDDFDEDLPSGDESDNSRAERRMLKRQRRAEAAGEQEEEDDDDDQPERKKTKKEIYEEIISKSKLHRYVGLTTLAWTYPSYSRFAGTASGQRRGQRAQSRTRPDHA